MAERSPHPGWGPHHGRYKLIGRLAVPEKGRGDG